MKTYYEKRQRELTAQITEIESKPSNEAQEKELRKLRVELNNYSESLKRKEFTNGAS